MAEICKRAWIYAHPLLYLPTTFFPAGFPLKLPYVANDHPLGLRFPLLQPANHAIVYLSVLASLTQKSEHPCDQRYSPKGRKDVPW